MKFTLMHNFTTISSYENNDTTNHTHQRMKMYTTTHSAAFKKSKHETTISAKQNLI